MTRYTNVALKRKYVPANSEYRESEGLESGLPEAGPSTPSEETRNDQDAPPKKKRKRGKPKWKHDQQNGVEAGGKDGDATGEAGEKAAGEGKKVTKSAKGKAKKKSKNSRMSGTFCVGRRGLWYLPRDQARRPAKQHPNTGESHDKMSVTQIRHVICAESRAMPQSIVRRQEE